MGWDNIEYLYEGKTLSFVLKPGQQKYTGYIISSICQFQKWEGHITFDLFVSYTACQQHFGGGPHGQVVKVASLWGAVNRSSSYRCGFGSHVKQGVLLAGCQVFFSWGSAAFAPSND